MLQLRINAINEYSIEWFSCSSSKCNFETFQLTGFRSTLAQDAATKNYVDTALNSSNVLASKNVFVEHW
jgi:hypothetical protein